MRLIAGILVISGLTALAGAAFACHDAVIAALGIVLAILWAVAIALRWPRHVHTGCLGLAAILCALSTSMGMPVLISLACLSTALYGWDLALMDLRTRAHPQDATFRLERKYVLRCLGLAGLGFGATLLARIVRVHLSFFAAFAISCLCLLLFLMIHRRVRVMMAKETLANEKRTARPPA